MSRENGFSGKGRFIAVIFVAGAGRVHLSDKLEPLKLEERFVQAVLHSAFIHQEAFEDPCAREILFG